MTDTTQASPKAHTVPVLTQRDLVELYDTLSKAHAFHTYRDAMNAELHMQATRYSPLTEALRQACELVLNARTDGPMYNPI